MKELRHNIPESLPSLGEALRRAAEQTQSAHSDLIHVIREKSEVILANSVVPDGLSLVFQQADSQLQDPNEDPEEEPAELATEDLDTGMYLGNGRKKPTTRQADQEISQREANNPSKSTRIQTKISLRQLSNSIGQRPAEITQQTLPERSDQAPEIIQLETTTQPELTQEQLKAQRRKIALEQREANRARRAAGKESAKALKSLPKELKQEKGKVQDSVFEQSKDAYTNLGENLFVLLLAPQVADIGDITIAKLRNQWNAARQKTQSLPENQQIELIHHLSSGLRLKEYSSDLMWEEAVRASGVDPSRLKPADYFLYGIAFLFYNNPLEEGRDFHKFVIRRRTADGLSLSAAEKIISDWLKRSPKRNTKQTKSN